MSEADELRDMKTHPSIAVAIPTRNQSNLLRDALDSVFRQTVPVVDVVVCDDAGTDDCGAVVEAYRRELPAEQAGVLRYVRNEACLGIGGNFDRGVREAAGEYVIKLDSDDILEPRFAEVLGGALEGNERAGWAHGNVMNIREDRTPLALAHTRKRSGYYGGGEALRAYLRHNDTCHCVMIRKRAYLEVGGYRPEMTTAEDWLLWLEMLMRGWGYCFVEEVVAQMRKYDDRWDLMTRRRQRFVASMEYMEGHLGRLLGEVVLPEGCTGEEVMAGFRATAAKLCRASAMDEGDGATRRLLFATAVRYVPTAGNRVAAAVLGPLPRGVTVRMAALGGMPRVLARRVLTTLKGGRRS